MTVMIPQSAKAETTPFAADYQRIQISRVCDLCGGVHPSTIDRWMIRENFPKPVIIGRIRFWRFSDVVSWFDAREGRA